MQLLDDIRRASIVSHTPYNCIVVSSPNVGDVQWQASVRRLTFSRQLRHFGIIKSVPYRHFSKPFYTTCANKHRRYYTQVAMYGNHQIVCACLFDKLLSSLSMK